MKDKLQSLIDTFFCSVDIDKFYSQNQKEKLTSWLCENGVIVPPCKVGEVVYELDIIVDNEKCQYCDFYYEGGMGDHPACNRGKYGNRANECIEIKEVVVTQKKLLWWLYMDDFGKTVFLSREEAKRALKGGE